MKLELKYLAPYLPYGLGIVNSTLNQQHIKAFFKLKGIKEDKIFLSRLSLPQDLKKYKPILRPLSDLDNNKLDYWIEFANKIDEMNVDYLIEALINKTFYAKDIHFSFRVYEVLFEMHFDVFGLIPQGLAIDINTLES